MRPVRLVLCSYQSRREICARCILDVFFSLSVSFVPFLPLGGKKEKYIDGEERKKSGLNDDDKGEEREKKKNKEDAPLPRGPFGQAAIETYASFRRETW